MELDDALRLLAPFHAAEREALRRAEHGTAYDPLGNLCDDQACPAIRDGMVVYADGHHLTRRFSATLAGPLLPFLNGAIHGGD